MLRPTARPLVVLRLGAWMAAALLMSSCSKKSLGPTPYPDVMGTSSSSQLIVYPDVPLTTYTLLDTTITDNNVTLKRSVCSQDDSLLGTVVERLGSDATVHGYIFDYSAADGFQPFRRESGGFRLLLDFPLQPTKRYPIGNADVFTFDDSRAVPSAFQDYVARGVVNGAITPSSPLTNLARITVTPTPTIHYTGHLNLCGDVPPAGQPVDSLLAMSWEAVPNADGYWVQVFQYGTGADVVNSRYPGPAFVGRTIDYFLAFFPGTVTSYKIGDPFPAGSHLLNQRTLLNNTDYAIRITAVNAEGELIAYPGESSRAYVYIRDPFQEGHYFLRSLGAFVVHTGNPGACPTNPVCGQALGTALPNVKLFPPNGVPTQIQ